MPDPTELMRWFRANYQVIQTEAKDMSHADSLQHPAFNHNCFNWVLGHIVNGRNNIHTTLGLPPVLPAEQTAVYEPESAPLLNGATAVDFHTLLAALDSSQKQLLSALEAMPSEKWQARHDDRQTIGAWVAFLQWHETFHCGQLNVLRQLSHTDKTI